MIYIPRVSKRRYPINILCPSNNSSSSPGDGSTAFWGASASGGSLATIESIYVLRPCIIKQVRLLVIVSGTLGTTEQATASVRVNDTTDTTISSAVQYNAVTARFDNTALNVPLAANDFFCLKVVFPTFVTNPTTVYHVFQILGE